uniref:Uncharacterized protein n=1 Tax=Setaria viridis TaxID=4556 RepID=A0A4U6VFK7_SETVI|nr:hypothetical protein SEVIR_3G306203v2 [Setaria viridis]
MEQVTADTYLPPKNPPNRPRRSTGTCRRLCAATSPQGLVLPSWPDHMKMMMITRSWSWS